MEEPMEVDDYSTEEISLWTKKELSQPKDQSAHDCTSSDPYQYDDKAPFSIADMVRETVNDYIRETYLPGFVFDDVSRLYYNSETGYYYDPNSSLYYYPETRCYYYYDECVGNIVYHSRLAADQHWHSNKIKKHAISHFGESYALGMLQDEIEIFECIYEMISNHCNAEKEEGLYLDEEEESDSASGSDNNEIKHFIEAERIEYPPCVRLIDTKNSNSLSVVTIIGATVGTNEGFDVLVKSSLDDLENNYPQEYARIEYDADSQTYSIVCLHEHCPIMVNDECIKTGESCFLEHEDRLYVAASSFVAHIHHGTNTCPGCEQSLRAIINPGCDASKKLKHKKVSCEALRRKNLRLLKAQYGLLDDENVFMDQTAAYVDRAKHRRMHTPKIQNNAPKIIPENNSVYAHCTAKPMAGSSSQSVEFRSNPKSTAQPIDDTNKGYKLLRGMGWKEGSGLGKHGTGIVQPVVNEVRPDRAGLGTQTKKDDTVLKPYAKSRIMEVTRERFKEIRE